MEQKGHLMTLLFEHSKTISNFKFLLRELMADEVNYDSLLPRDASTDNSLCR